MAVTPNSVVSPQTPKHGVVKIVNADASAAKTLFTAGTNGSKVNGVILQSDDTAARDIQIGITRTAVFYPFTTVAVPIGAGNSGTVPPVSAFSAANCPGLPVDNDGQPYITLESGDTLDIKSLSTVTSGKTVSASCNGGNY